MPLELYDFILEHKDTLKFQRKEKCSYGKNIEKQYLQEHCFNSSF